jgi:hypothetical protein
VVKPSSRTLASEAPGSFSIATNKPSRIGSPRSRQGNQASSAPAPAAPARRQSVRPDRFFVPLRRESRQATGADSFHPPRTGVECAQTAEIHLELVQESLHNLSPHPAFARDWARLSFITTASLSRARCSRLRVSDMCRSAWMLRSPMRCRRARRAGKTLV